MKPRARQLFNYINKVYGIFQSFAMISDGRVNPSIPLPTILKVLFSAMVLKVHSFNLVESYLREGYFSKFLSSAGFGISADTFGYALARTTLRQFKEINDSVI